MPWAWAPPRPARPARNRDYAFTGLGPPSSDAAAASYWLLPIAKSVAHWPSLFNWRRSGESDVNVTPHPAWRRMARPYRNGWLSPPPPPPPRHTGITCACNKGDQPTAKKAASATQKGGRYVFLGGLKADMPSLHAHVGQRPPCRRGGVRARGPKCIPFARPGLAWPGHARHAGTRHSGATLKSCCTIPPCKKADLFPNPRNSWHMASSYPNLEENRILLLGGTACSAAAVARLAGTRGRGPRYVLPATIDAVAVALTHISALGRIHRSAHWAVPRRAVQGSA